MRFLSADEMPTMQMIRDDLIDNPPGQGCMGMHVEFITNAPFYIIYLMAELERARHSKRKRKRQPSIQKQVDQEVRVIQRAYFNSDAYKESEKNRQPAIEGSAATP